MGKYWYKDNEGKWRLGDDTDDFFVNLLCLLLFAAIWIIWKPISWWLLKKEVPTTGWITLWIIAVVLTIILIIYLNM